MRKVIGGWMMAAALIAATTGCAQSEPKSETQDAENALKSFTTAVGNGQVDEVVGMLPASYVKDIGTVINTFAERMDAEVWNKGRDLMSTLLTVIAAKSDLLADMAKEEGGAKMDAKALREGCNELATFVKSDTMALNNLKKTDAKAFAKALTAPLSKVAKGSDAKLPYGMDWNLTIKSAEKKSDDTVVISVEGDDENVTMKLVEGKWIEEFKGWKDGKISLKSILDDIQGIDFTSDKGKQTKTQVLMVMGMIEPSIKKLESAETKEELQQVMGLFIIMMMQMGK